MHYVFQGHVLHGPAFSWSGGYLSGHSPRTHIVYLPRKLSLLAGQWVEEL